MKECYQSCGGSTGFSLHASTHCTQGEEGGTLLPLTLDMGAPSSSWPRAGTEIVLRIMSFLCTSRFHALHLSVFFFSTLHFSALLHSIFMLQVVRVCLLSP